MKNKFQLELSSRTTTVRFIIWPHCLLSDRPRISSIGLLWLCSCSIVWERRASFRRPIIVTRRTVWISPRMKFTSLHCFFVIYNFYNSTPTKFTNSCTIFLFDFNRFFLPITCWICRQLNDKNMRSTKTVYIGVGIYPVFINLLSYLLLFQLILYRRRWLSLITVVDRMLPGNYWFFLKSYIIIKITGQVFPGHEYGD